MKALILNSGIGKRMGDYTANQPKCMTPLLDETIIERQLRQLALAGIQEVVITTGPFADLLKEHIKSLKLPMELTFINNPDYLRTNYIYSIYLAKEYVRDDIVLLHGDLVFEQPVLNSMLSLGSSCMAVSTTCPLPEKDFKAVRKNGKILKVGVEFFADAAAAQPLYVLLKKDWMMWLDNICQFIGEGKNSCYAECALNEIDDQLNIFPYDYQDFLCQEVDCEQDLAAVRRKLTDGKRGRP